MERPILPTAAEAVYSAEGQMQVKEIIQYYMTNARIMKKPDFPKRVWKYMAGRMLRIYG